jgi:chromosome segregation ATPase
VYVYLDEYQDMSQPESRIDSDPLVEELRDRVRFLEKELERRGDEGERYQRIIAGLAQSNSNLTDRLKELEASPTESEAPQRSDMEAQDPAEGPPGPRHHPADVTDASRGSDKPWWRRLIGG